MQNAGTLRKRTRRTLVKVNGLGTVQYSKEEDNFDIRTFKWDRSCPSPTPSFYSKNGPATTSIRVNNLKQYLSRPSSRVTRDPRYHDVEEGPTDQGVQAVGPDGGQFTSTHNLEGEGHDRPYLLRKGTYNRLRLAIFLGMFIFNCPWIWNRKTHRIDRWSPFWVRLYHIHGFFTTIQSIGLTIYQIYCFIGIYSRDLDSYRGIFAYSLIIYWYVCFLGYKLAIFLYEDRMRKYVNALLDFNQEYVEKYLVYADKYIEFSSARMIMKFSIPAAASQIPNSLFFFLILPSAPYYLTSKINPRPWYALIPGIIQDVTVIGQTILSYIIISWVQILHAATMEFWMREMHKGADSVYTRDEIRSMRIALPTYRMIQLLSSQFNEFMAPVCFPIWKFSVAFGFIPCGYLWIRSMNKVFIEEFPGILVYPFGTVNCFTMSFGCLQMAAEMYDIANSFIMSWSRTKQKDFRRILMSCPTVKVKVGRGFYFITASTTITFFQTITGYIIDCLLTFP